MWQEWMKKYNDLIYGKEIKQYCSCIEDLKTNLKYIQENGKFLEKIWAKIQLRKIKKM